MDNKSPEISQLFERITCGDRDALQEFITRHGSRIRRRILRLLDNLHGSCYEERDDILSSTRRRADVALLARRIEAGDPEALAHYIQTIAKNRALKTLKRERRVRDTLSDMALCESRHQSFNHNASQAGVIAKTLSRVAPQERHMISLRARGCSHSQVAEHLGIPLGQYRKRWSRLKLKVRKFLASNE